MNYDFEKFKKLYNLETNEDKEEKLKNCSEQATIDIFANKPQEDLDNNALFNELIEDEPDIMENTLEIKNFKLDEETIEILSLDEPKEEKPLEKPKKKKWWHLPWTTVNDHHLENAFVNCAVLGFITAGMGYGMLAYIISHI